MPLLFGVNEAGIGIAVRVGGGVALSGGVIVTPGVNDGIGLGGFTVAVIGGTVGSRVSVNVAVEVRVGSGVAVYVLVGEGVIVAVSVRVAV